MKLRQTPAWLCTAPTLWLGVVDEGLLRLILPFFWFFWIAGFQLQSDPTEITSAPEIACHLPQSTHPPGRGNILKIF